jgi:hypothetical protein
MKIEQIKQAICISKTHPEYTYGFFYPVIEERGDQLILEYNNRNTSNVFAVSGDFLLIDTVLVDGVQLVNLSGKDIVIDNAFIPKSGISYKEGYYTTNPSKLVPFDVVEVDTDPHLVFDETGIEMTPYLLKVMIHPEAYTDASYDISYEYKYGRSIYGGKDGKIRDRKLILPPAPSSTCFEDFYVPTHIHKVNSNSYHCKSFRLVR